MNANTILGSGLVFPITLNDKGSVVPETGVELVRSSIKNIIAYTVGQRFFLREFGIKDTNLLDELNTDLVGEILSVQIAEAIHTYEKRVENISVIAITDYDSKLSLRITYSIRQTQKHDSFIFPFYSEIKT